MVLPYLCGKHIECMEHFSFSMFVILFIHHHWKKEMYDVMNGSRKFNKIVRIISSFATSWDYVVDFAIAVKFVGKLLVVVNNEVILFRVGGKRVQYGFLFFISGNEM